MCLVSKLLLNKAALAYFLAALKAAPVNDPTMIIRASANLASNHPRDNDPPIKNKTAVPI